MATIIMSIVAGMAVGFILGREIGERLGYRKWSTIWALAKRDGRETPQGTAKDVAGLPETEWLSSMGESPKLEAGEIDLPGFVDPTER